MVKTKKPNGRPKTYRSDIILTKFRMPIPTECLDEVRDQIKLITNKHLLYPDDSLDEKSIFKNKVSDVQKYFKDKILKNSFDFTEITEITFSILIDNFFFFKFLYNFDEGKNYLWESDTTFIKLNLTDEDFKTIVFNNKDFVLNNIKNKLILQKEKELENLKKKLNI
jgi:hypothetical protein